MKIKWDEVGKRLYETGVDHGVLFPMGEDNAYVKGVPWYGLSAVNESPSGGEPNPVWADNIKYLNLMSAEDFGATIEAYTYPDEFEACNGCAEIAPGVTISQQDRKMFGFCYTQLYDVEQEMNGLYTYGRKPKFDMEIIRRINSRKAAVEEGEA